LGHFPYHLFHLFVDLFKFLSFLIAGRYFLISL
jgi:hypothetical protein